MAVTYTHTITLNPGEQFTVPPGGKILFTTDNAGLESVCAELPTEELACYGFILIAATGVNGGETEVFEDTQIKYLGVNLNGEYYPFAAPVGYGSAGTIPDPTPTVPLVDALQALPFGSMFIEPCVSSSDDTSRQSLKHYIIFKTTPSIGDNIEVVAQTSSPNNGSGIPQVQFIVPGKTYASIVSEGNNNVCECVVGGA